MLSNSPLSSQSAGYDGQKAEVLRPIRGRLPPSEENEAGQRFGQGESYKDFVV